ncbi:MAG: hypothetical protein A2Y12_14255 [Planctomycetes bacterium GWF2_42_9]|nr:MAG: hypothetical protein A2Y12_14255 [Planctomycetes bacterium GWF2_42_9]HAL45408.1 hypothetical protein [Phycisphaerales bacterium]
MIIVLAEIADKMSSIPRMWVCDGVVGVVLFCIGLIHRFASFAVFFIGLLISILFVYYAYYDAFADPTFSPDVQREMGYIWIVNSIISPFCLALFPMMAVLFHIFRNKKQLRTI